MVDAVSTADVLAPPPPPPRRETSPTASTSSNATKPPPASSGSWWNRAKASTANAWDSAYKKADQVGYWTNKQGARLGTEAFYPTSLDVESTKCARILRTFTMDAADLPEEMSLADRRKSQVVLKKIPPAAIAAAQGLAIFTVFRSGFIVSGASGSGVVLARQKDGSWSAPSGVLLHTVGFGFSAGVDVYDVVLILRNEKSVQSFKHPRISLGGEVSIAAGPVGNGFAIETSHHVAPVWSYTKSKGLYGGANLAGTVLVERNDENARSYGRKIKAAEVLEGEVVVPHWCEGLHQTILAAEGLDYRPDLIPLGPSTSEVAPSPDLASLGSPTTNDPTIASPSTASPPASPSAPSPNVSFLSSFTRSTSQTSGRSRASSTATSISSVSTATAVRKLPKEELDDEDLEARRELEAALRSFGIDDPNINAKSRAEDKLLVVEEGVEQEKPDGENEEAASPGASVLGEVVEYPPESPTAPGRPSTDTVKSSTSGVSGLSRNGSISGSPLIVGAGEKPPVPPRRTPRIGTTTSATNSPAMSSPVVSQKEEAEGKSEGELDKAEENKKDEQDKPREEDGAETEASESFEDAEEGAAVTPAAVDGEKKQLGEEKQE
ncbi:hypothetical protein JCM11641_002424 [Rhodosporidiobolus odoratus]